ncbi:arginine--tRNA ligase [candidate division WOR-3 bacterium 4484_100]|uniref:Arginine--tRNA ligase n=1 Tax=candidate division WOR-3 bacterium 4484_100 TaxID=1936077 RepID=A0A1V4QG44_UNCW3|nr:MAG: arginine--tRNA ligase [candidate division WOR-3 bacterium 4484_100]
MIRQRLRNLLTKLYPDEDIVIDYVPKDKKGDYSTNLAFKIASRTGEKPETVAERIAKKVKDPLIADTIVYPPGFINFEISKKFLLDSLFEPLEINLGNGKKVLIEFVSVNPTGPINIVNARAAAIGDSLIRVLNKTGFKAEAEYYINDQGRQTDLLAISIRERINQLKGKKAKIPEDGYHGEYLIDLAREVDSKGISEVEEIRRFAVNHFINEHKNTLKNFGVEFDYWIRESDVYQKGLVDKVLKILNEKGLTYNKDNALFFRATQFGDTEDRVIITSQKRHTYLLPDIAYHLDKISRGYDQLINIWGPDHHGYIKRLIGGIIALGYTNDLIKIIIAQEVKLKRGGEYIKMSKRAGTFTSLDQLLAEIPKDVVRFFFLTRSCSQHLDFDLDLARKQSEDNPVYYVQYAYARIRSIIRFAREKGLELPETPELSLIDKEEEFDLLKSILRFPEVLEDVVRNLDPYPITYYLIDLARNFHYFYQKYRVVGDDRKLSGARLFLVNKTAQTISDGLNLIGVSCPERM